MERLTQFCYQSNIVKIKLFMIENLDSPEMKTLGLVLVGGKHHILHLIPVTVGLQKFKNFQIFIFVMTDLEKQECKKVLDSLGVENVQVKVLKSNRIAKLFSTKLAFLLSHIKIWKSLDAILVVERTSTILRYFCKNLPPLFHIPHGAGDRAKSYDSRIRHFDYVLVAGQKDKNRMVSLGLVSSENCFVTGYIKPSAVEKLNRPPFQRFKNTSPLVLYNPHFSKDLSSWTEFGLPLLDAFSKNKDFNFIFAPHVRLSQTFRPDELEALRKFEIYDHIHIDLGSRLSIDMSYTRAADIYVGDVSSQVYEFLSRPKPCAFIGNSNVKWQGNPDYAHWTYGPVCHSVEDIMVALQRAESDLDLFREDQIEGCLQAKGHPDWNPIERASDVIGKILDV